MNAEDGLPAPATAVDRRTLIKLSIAACIAPALLAKPVSAQSSDSLVVALAFAPKFLNPNYDFDGANYYITPNLLSKLVDYDNDGKIIGDLAKEWTISPDGKVYTFALHDGVSWSDGKPFSADDVVFTVNSLIKEKAYGRQAITGLAGIEAPNARTVRMTLEAPNSSFLDQLAQRYGFVVLPKHVYDGTDPRQNPANQKPVGIGAYVVDEFVAGNYVSLKANPTYFRGAPKISQIFFKFYPDMSAAVTALRSKQIGFIASSPPFNTLAQLRQTPGTSVDVVDSSPFIVVWLGFNMARKPLDDVRVRTAIAHAINREQINRLVYAGQLRTADTAYVSTSWGHDADARQPAFDVRKANELLDAAGLQRKDGGIRFGLTYTGFRASTWGAREIGEVMKQQLAAVGIALEIEFLDFSVFAQKILGERNFDITWSGGPHGPDPQLFANYVTSKGNRNAMGYANPEVDAWFNAARESLDPAKAKEIYARIQKQVAKDLPRLSLLEWKNPYVYETALKGLWWQPGAVGTVPSDSYRLVSR